MIEIDTRLRVARGIAKTETQASTEVFETLKRRGHPEAPPAVVSDGWGGIKQAMIAVYGQVPSYKGRGRRPTKKRPVEGWQYLQVVKQRDTHGRFLGTARRVIFGEEAPVLALLGKSTSYIETDAPDDAPYEWALGGQGSRFLEAAWFAQGPGSLGRPGLQRGPPVEDVASGGQRTSGSL